MKYYIIFIAWKVSSFDGSYLITNWMVWKETQYMSFFYTSLSWSKWNLQSKLTFDCEKWPRKIYFEIHFFPQIFLDHFLAKNLNLRFRFHFDQESDV